jgi:hypothetical protein
MNPSILLGVDCQEMYTNLSIRKGRGKIIPQYQTLHHN